MGRVIETKDMALEDWLDLLFDPPEDVDFVDFQFPTDRHLNEYLETIDTRSDDEVIKLLEELLMESSSLGSDELYLRSVLAMKQLDPKMAEQMMTGRRYKRLVGSLAGGPPPWEGNTWILELLPDFPREALQAIDAYLLAHFWSLPDGRINGLNDASAVIRAKFIGLPHTRPEVVDTLLSLTWRDFEYLICELYARMGYETELTAPRGDGGRDIVATKDSPGALELVMVECKLYRKPVGVANIRGLLGVVSGEKANKGVLVTTSSFTKGALRFAAGNPQIELISGEALIPLLNEYLGARWPAHIDTLITRQRAGRASVKDTDNQ
jgi:restriction system protein